jgi:predicted transcriptional regulator
MPTGDKFLAEFNRLENFLRRKVGSTRYMAFSDLVKTASRNDSTVRRYIRELLAFAKLRNAIVHDVEYPGRIIADPRPEVVDQLAQVRRMIESPERVIPKFAKSIHVFDVGDRLVQCLNYMKEHDFSQVVVLREGIHVLLSSEGIAGWLRSAQSVGLIDLENATVGDALRFEGDNICRYLPRDAPVEAAIEAFEKALAQDMPRLQAVLVTEHGRPEERPMGIITPWDLIGMTGENELA